MKRSTLVAQLSLAAAAATFTIALPTAQPAPRANAEFLRKAYDTYTSQRQASPYKSASCTSGGRDPVSRNPNRSMSR